MIKTLKLNPAENIISGGYEKGDTVFCECDASNEAFSVRVPDATSLNGVNLIFEKSDSSVNVVTGEAYNNQKINGVGSFALTTQYDHVGIISNKSNYYKISSAVLGIGNLTNPAADRIMFWDNSANSMAWLTVGNSIAISTTTLDTIQDIRITANPTFAGGTFTEVVTGVTPIAAEHLTTRAFVESVAAGSSKDYFISDTPSGVGDSFLMYPADTEQDQSTEQSAGETTDDNQLIFSWLSEVGEPGITLVRAGVYELHTHLHLAGGSPTTIFHWKLVKVAANGTSSRVILMSSELSDELTTSEVSYETHAYLAAGVPILATDRFLLEFYVNVTGGGESQTTVTMEGAHDCHLSVKVPSDIYQSHGNVLDDLNTLGAVGADSQFLVGTGEGAFAWESGATVRASLGLGAADSPTFVGLTLSGLTQGLKIGTASYMLAPLGITGDATNIGDRHEGIWIRAKTEGYIVQINVRGSRLEIGGGASLDTAPAMSVNYLTGKVGIGTASKLSKLTVKQSADESNIGGTTAASSSTTITGSATTFTTKLGVGDRISLSSAASTYATVIAIASDTSLTVDTALGNGTNQTINAKRSLFRLDDASDNVKLIVSDRGNAGIGTTRPNAPLEVKGSLPGQFGGFHSGLLHVTNAADSEFAASVITGHNSYNTNKQLWYLGSTSNSNNDDIAFINRQNGSLSLSTNNTERLMITNTGAITISADVATITHSGTTSLTIASTSGTVLIEGVTFNGSDIGIAAQADLIQLTGANTMLVNGTLQCDRIGVNIAPNTNIFINIDDNTINTDADIDGLKIRLTKTAGDTNTNDHFQGIRLDIKMDQAAGTISHFYGFKQNCIMTNGNVGSVSASRDIFANDSYLSLVGGKVWGDAYAARFHSYQQTTKITGDFAVVAIRGRINDDTDIDGTSYMLWMDDAYLGDDFDYNIYQVGTTPNYFGGSLQVDGNMGVGAAPSANIKLYAFAPDAQSTINVGINGSTLSDGVDNFGGYFSATGGGGTNNKGCYAAAANATNNYHFYSLDGDECSGGAWNDSSSAKMKTGIKTISSTKAEELYNELENLNIRSYKHKAEKKFKNQQTRYGLMAEEVPDFLSTQERKSLSGGRLANYALLCIKYQKEKITNLENRIEVLENN